MSKPYLIISSDCHAGPETPEYRDYLDPQYRDRFDESLAERDRLIAERKLAAPISMGGDAEFQEEWFSERDDREDHLSLHEGGLRCGWDAPKRTRSSTTTASRPKSSSLVLTPPREAWARPLVPGSSCTPRSTPS